VGNPRTPRLGPVSTSVRPHPLSYNRALTSVSQKREACVQTSELRYHKISGLGKATFRLCKREERMRGWTGRGVEWGLGGSVSRRKSYGVF